MPNLFLRDHNLTGEKAEGNEVGLVSRGRGRGCGGPKVAGKGGTGEEWGEAKGEGSTQLEY